MKTDVRMRYVAASGIMSAIGIALILWLMIGITDYKTILTASVVMLVFRIVAEKSGIELWIQNKIG